MSRRPPDLIPLGLAVYLGGPLDGHPHPFPVEEGTPEGSWLTVFAPDGREAYHFRLARKAGPGGRDGWVWTDTEPLEGVYTPPPPPPPECLHEPGPRGRCRWCGETC